MCKGLQPYENYHDFVDHVLKMACTIAILLLLMGIGAEAGDFLDDFSRADNADVDNGWLESGALNRLDPQIVGEEVSWVNLGDTDEYALSTITRTFEAAVDVSADLKIPTVGSGEPYMILRIYDSGDSNYVQVFLSDVVNGGVQTVRIHYNGSEVGSAGITDPTIYHNYRFVIDESTGKVTVYFDGIEQWVSSNGSMGPAVKAEIVAKRWWRWHRFYADNFVALGIPDNSACQLAWENGVGVWADFNHDCQVNIEDVAVLATYWLSDESAVDISPESSPDGKVDMRDFGVLVDSWLADMPYLSLFDDDTSTGISIEPGTYTFELNPAGPIIFVKLFIDASVSGTVTVKFDDIMARDIQYDAGTHWYKLRIPYSTARRMELAWDSSGALLGEMRLLGKTPISTEWPSSGVQTMNVSASLDVGSDPTCVVPFGVMCNWFSRGVVDGITDPDSRPELIQRFQEAGIDGFRYPGGAMCYGYPPTQEAIQVYIDAGIGPYGLYLDPLYWSSPEEFLIFCKDAGITAWYQFDPGYWYDRVNHTVEKVLPWDGAGDVTWVDNLDEAAADAAAFAQYAETLGVDVVWEIGNEDFSKYKADTFARICVAFSEAIRLAVPSARICIIGDGESWSDYTWADDLVTALASRGMGEVDFSSRHCYLTGAGGTTPQEVGDNAVDFWRSAIQYQYTLDRWHNAGFTTSKQAMTEFNIAHNGYVIDHPEIEHSVGRALGDAQLVCELYRKNMSIFFHDLVRTSPDSVWFARLDYYPNNPGGSRYYLFPETAAVSLTTVHGHGNIVYNSYSDRVCISRHDDFAYITIINNENTYKLVNVDLQNVTSDPARDPQYSVFRAANADCCFFDYYTETGQLAGEDETVEIKCYPYSVTAVKVYLQ